MRLSSLTFAAVLLFSSIAFAQHHETGSAPSPSPSSPTTAPAPSPAPGTSTSAPVSHSSTVSVPGAVSVHESRITPSSGSTASHGSSPAPTEPRSGPTAATPTHAPRLDQGRVIPDQKISGETRIVSAPRIGQDLPEKAPVMKPGPPQLRHRICDTGPCKENGTEWKADPPRTDLRRRVCPNGPCSCPPGQTAGKGGCVANTPIAEPAIQPFEQCQPGETWNGAVCTPSYSCTPAERWNGARCVVSADECVSIDGRAAILVNELRGLKARIQDACGQNPPGQDCEDLKLRQTEVLQRYQMLVTTEAGPECQATLETPGSLE